MDRSFSIRLPFWTVKAFLLIMSTLFFLVQGGEAMALQLTSTAFSAGGNIPKEFTCDGADHSPPLAWSGAPDGTAAFALIMDDPDAPPGTWVHWVIYNIPKTNTGLEAGQDKTERLGSGAMQGAVWGVQDFSRVGYHGPCPPPGKAHRYVFKLFALDTALTLAPKATKDQLLQSIKGHTLAETSLTGLYGR